MPARQLMTNSGDDNKNIGAPITGNLRWVGKVIISRTSAECYLSGSDRIRPARALQGLDYPIGQLARAHGRLKAGIDQMPKIF